MSQKELVPQLNPVLARLKKTEAKEELEKVKIYEDIESLALLTRQLKEKREHVSVMARCRDLKYIEQLDDLISITMEAITEDPETLKTAIKDMIKAGKVEKLQSLLTTLGIAIDKRENMLSTFDDTRANDRSKKKLRLNVIWKGSLNGDNALAVQAEVDK